MNEFKHLAREDLISLIRGQYWPCGRGKHSVTAPACEPDIEAGFPVFDEHGVREFETSLWPIRIFDRETLRYLAVNDAALRLYGYTRQEFLALTPLDTRHPKELDNAIQDLSLPAHYLRYLGMRWHITKSGDAIAVEVIAQDIVFAGCRACLSLTIDVTDRTRILEVLHQRDQAFQTMVEDAPDITARFDRKLCFVYVSSAITELTGLAPGLLIGKTCEALGMPGKEVSRWNRGLANVFESGREERLDISYPTPSGTRYFDVRVIPECGMSLEVNTALSIARDVTERKKYELIMQRNLALSQLFGSLARVANEAGSAEAAMSGCLAKICSHGDWTLGRVELRELNAGEVKPARSIWYVPEAQRFSEFVQYSENLMHYEDDAFIGGVLQERRPVWVENLQRLSPFNRRLFALKHGIKTGFAFPIIIDGIVVAFMELFSTRQRPRDDFMMDAAQTIASQLSRIVEREFAQESNARLASIVETSQDAIISRTADGAVITWNRAAENLFGYMAAEIVGQNIDLLVPAELRPEAYRRRERLMQGEVSQAFETVRLGKSGCRLDVSVCVSPIRNAEGLTVAVSTVIRDISGRKHAERELQRQKKLLESVIDNLPASVFIKDAKTLRHIIVNRAAREMIDFGKKQPIGLTSHELFAKEQADAYWESDQQALQSGQVVEVPDHEAVGLAGDSRIRHGRKVVVFDDDGEPWVLIGITEDVTDRKRAEDELKRQKKLLEAIIEHLPVGVTVKDANTRRYILRNRMADELTGVFSFDAIGKCAEEIYTSEHARLIHQSDEQALERGGVITASPMIVQAATGRTVRNLKIPVVDAPDRYTYIVAIIDDVTDIEQTQSALMRSEQRLNQLILMSPASIFSFSLVRPFCTTFITNNVTTLIGWLPDDFTGDPQFRFDHIHPDERAHVEEAVSRIVIDGRYQCEYRFRHKEGSWRWIHEEGRAVCDENGVTHEAIGSWTDVTDDHVEANRLQRALQQRDALVREVHHRIKNNIQGVIGLLRRKIKASHRNSPEIEEAIMQLQTISMVYGMGGNRPTTPLFLRSILNSICMLAENLTSETVERNYRSASRQPLRIVDEEAVAVAVALNELVFNALKHKTTEAGEKKVRITLREEEEYAEIRITNHGLLPARFDFARGLGVSDGLDLVRTLILQRGSVVNFYSRDEEVEVVLTLSPPLLAASVVEDMPFK